jgi:hypothetical protein
VFQSQDHFITSFECGIVCVSVQDVQAMLVCLKDHEQKQLSKDLSYSILESVLKTEGKCLWVDSGELGLELILYERAVDAIQAAATINQFAAISSGNREFRTQAVAHWGEVTLDNRTLKVFGGSIQDVKALLRSAPVGAALISPSCEQAVAQQLTCAELSGRSWIFISYSRADNKRPNFLEELLQQIKPYEAAGQLGLFVGARIRPGDKWFRSILASLANHQLAVLLVGPGFFASDFIRLEELPYIKEAYSQKGIKVLWVYLIETAYVSETWIAALQAAHYPADPIRRMGKLQRNEVWQQVVHQITELSNTHPHGPLSP